MSRLTASRAAFDLIASFEGFRARAVQTPTGGWTLGFGHTATAREGLLVTREEADDLLRWDVLAIEDQLRQVALTPLSQNQFDAMVSFAFNIGMDKFRQSDVLKHLNQGQPIGAALALHAWRKAYVNGRLLTIDALVRRRAAEAALFLETQGPRPAAPTSVVIARTVADESLEEPTRPDAMVTTSDLIADTGKEVASDDAVLAHTESVPGATHARVLAQNVALDVVHEKTPTIDDSQPIQSAPSQLLVTDQPQTIPPTPSAAEALARPDIARPDIAPTETAPLSGLRAPPLTPFPGTQAPEAANRTDLPPDVPANDGANTRLHANPEPIDDPQSGDRHAKRAGRVGAISNQSLLTWVLMALGAGLLAFGLFIGWRAGLLSLEATRIPLNSNALLAILTGAGGLIMLVTSAVAAFTQTNDGSTD